MSARADEVKEDGKGWPSVAIIILNWENYEDTSRCLKSLCESSYPNFDVFVVDNGSTDRSGQQIANEFRKCTVIFNDSNRGFAVGNNRGIAKAFEEDFDYLLLLNEDTTVSEGFLTPLVETMEQHSDVGIVGGIIKDFDSDEIQYAGAKFIPWLGGITRIRTEPKDNKIYRTGYIPGALMLLSPKLVKENDLLNDDYFFGMEDVDAGWVAQRTGWKVLVNQESEIHHKGGITTKSRSPFWTYHQTRNRLQFASERLNRNEKALFYLTFFALMSARMVHWMMELNWSLAQAGAISIIDQIRGLDPKRHGWFE